MEEDIKLLEEKIKNGVIYVNCGNSIEKLIENLIKEYREKEEIIKKLVKNLLDFSNTVVKEFIPKSKVKEMIEEIKANIEESKDVLYGAENIITVLQQLLEE